jgi:hypothetical protein
VYEPSNPGLYRGLSLVKRTLLLPRSVHFIQTTLRGIACGENSDLTMSYIGEGESFEYLKKLCFSRILREDSRPCTIWKLKDRLGNRAAGNIAFVEVNRWLKKLIPHGGYDTFPWIRQRVYLKDESYQKRKSKIKAKYGRKARKFQYRFEIVNDSSSTKRFYEELLVPYVNFRFGDTTHVRNFKEIERVIKNGFLLQVFHQDEWIAGAACRRRKREITIFALGLISDFQYHLQRGALSSVYYFLFQWAEQNNIDTIDLLRSKADVNDGVYEHKRSWGATVEKDTWPHTVIRVFVPEAGDIPSKIKGFLVWTENGFVELQQAVTK